MPAAPYPAEDAARVAALRRLDLMDTPREEDFDGFATIISEILGVPTAMVALMDEDRQWFKAAVGAGDMTETPRDIAFCGYTILGSDVMWVEDMHLDPRFVDNPLVLGGPEVRFYVGAPLEVGGHNVGTICALDTAPRTYDARAAALLRSVAQLVSGRIRERARAAATMALLDHSTDAAMVVDQTGQILVWSHGAEVMFGWSRDEALGQSLDIISPDDMTQTHRMNFARYVAGKEGGVFDRPVELQAKRRDGALFPMEMTLAGWSQGGLRVVGVLARDATVRHAQEALLLQAFEAAKSSDQAKTRFLSNMTHELRTPLNGVLGMAQVLATTPLTEQQRRLTDTIVNSGQTLAEMLTQVVTVSGETSRATHVVFSPTDVLTDLADRFGAMASARGLGFRLQLDRGLPATLEGDMASLQQGLTALLDNAVRFTAEGEVVLSTTWAGRRLACTVSDTGPGFDMARLPELMQPFTQADVSATRRHDGAGLGLAIVDRVVAATGGRLDVKSTPGEGAVFMLDLPMAAVPVAMRA
ncbi:MAG: ATP-binding protein [Caulobacter sp.]|nr:ATP-binding protein [Caulobacter sp.]